MKTVPSSLHRFAVCVGLGVAVCSCAHLDSRERAPLNPQALEIRARLDQIVFPDADLQEVSLTDALQFVSDTRRFTGGSNGVSMTASLGTVEYPKITLHRKAVTFRQLLDEVCRQADLVWWIGPQSIVIIPRSKAPHAS